MVHNTCHACGLKVYANFSFQARAILVLEALVNFSSRPAFQVDGALLDGQSLAGLQGRVPGDVDICCVKQVGFQIGVDPTWFAPSCMNVA